MTDDQLRQVFKYGLSRLVIDDDGLTRDNNPLDLKTMMALCAAIKASAADGDTTIAALHWHRCATLTEQLVGAWGFANPGLTKQWLLSRGELLAVQLDHR